MGAACGTASRSVLGLLGHPGVQRWFLETYPSGPTQAELGLWESLGSGEHALVASPTGSGKTMGAFLGCIDALARAEERGEGSSGVAVLYVSPLRALAADVAQNLLGPLEGIAEAAESIGVCFPRLSVAVRDGDTPSSERARLLRRPPGILVTTPESLYLMLTSRLGRQSLARLRFVIVDELHALASDKRGAHLALSLSRLASLQDEEPQMIGLSATQRPLEALASLILGARTKSGRKIHFVDCGWQRRALFELKLPSVGLGSVWSQAAIEEAAQEIAAAAESRRGVLVFVHTRRLAERFAHLVSKGTDSGAVAAHHGSLSKDRRRQVEAGLKQGELKVVVATASLELGVDLGFVELVCLIGAPRSISELVQRAGRSGHRDQKEINCWLYPTSQEELLDSLAALAAWRQGRLEETKIARPSLDVAFQHVVAEVSVQPATAEELYERISSAAPYRDLSSEDFLRLVELGLEGVATPRGRRGALLKLDPSTGVISARRGAQMLATASGGAIPDTGDYRVVAEAGEVFLGTVNEDWALETMRGDVFVLGSEAWCIQRVEKDVVWVREAERDSPTVPFWLGEAPGRSDELSRARSELHEVVEEAFGRARDPIEEAVSVLVGLSGASREACLEAAKFLWDWRQITGSLPTRRRLVVEKFFDEAEGLQIVVHSPYGARINRALGLLLRKRFCIRFDFELQAAADDDCVLLSLGGGRDLTPEQLKAMFLPLGAERALIQAVLRSPMFLGRWRWVVSRALFVARRRGAKRVAPLIQRMEAEDLLSAVFPQITACQENPTGPLEPPDHVLVEEALRECLFDAMDFSGLEELLCGVDSGEVDLVWSKRPIASPGAGGILNGRPYTYLDDAPLEDRRSRAVITPRQMPSGAELGRAEREALFELGRELERFGRDKEELWELLWDCLVLEARPELKDPFLELSRAGRATSRSIGGIEVWSVPERARWLEAIVAGPCFEGPPSYADAVLEAVRGHMEHVGPVELTEAFSRIPLPPSFVAEALRRLEEEGFLLRGRFGLEGGEGERLVSRRVLARACHIAHSRRLRHQDVVPKQAAARFVLCWQHLGPWRLPGSPEAVLRVVRQLKGLECPAWAWEAVVLPQRIEGFRAEWLDQLGYGGSLCWGRLKAPPSGPGLLRFTNKTPIAYFPREELAFMLAVARQEGMLPRRMSGALLDVIEALRRHGARFRAELASLAGRLQAEVDAALSEGAAAGVLSADGFASLRRLYHRSRAKRSLARRAPSKASLVLAGEGRWWLLESSESPPSREELLVWAAEAMIERWGVVFRELALADPWSPPWRELRRALATLEARGLVRAGRFVAGFSGEQYASTEAVALLRELAQEPADPLEVVVHGLDPAHGLLSLLGGGDSKETQALEENQRAWRAANC